MQVLRREIIKSGEQNIQQPVNLKRLLWNAQRVFDKEQGEGKKQSSESCSTSARLLHTSRFHCMGRSTMCVCSHTALSGLQPAVSWMLRLKTVCLQPLPNLELAVSAARSAKHLFVLDVYAWSHLSALILLDITRIKLCKEDDVAKTILLYLVSCTACRLGKCVFRSEPCGHHQEGE